MKLREAVAAEVARTTGSAVKSKLMAAILAATSSPPIAKRTAATAASPDNQTGKRRVVIVMRERNGKTLPFVAAVRRCRGPDDPRTRRATAAPIYADEATHWDQLHARYHDASGSIIRSPIPMAKPVPIKPRVFSAGYAAPKSASIIKIAGPYLNAYANEMAWREDNRRVSNGELYFMAADAALEASEFRNNGAATGNGAQNDEQ